MPVKFVSPSEGRFSYAHVFEARAMPVKPGETPKEAQFSFNYLIPKTDVAQYNALMAALRQEFDESKKRKNKNSIPENIQFDDYKKGWWKNPVKDGDEYANESLAKKGQDRPEYRGFWYFQATKKESDGKPSVSRIENRQLVAITDKADFYSGCWGRCSVNFSAYNHASGGPGVSIYINNLIKTRDDEPLQATVSRAEDDFKDLVDPNDFLD